MWRRWISGLAMMGMLLHVAVFVRHHQMMAGPQSAVAAMSTVAAIAEQAAAEGNPILVVDGMVICHSDQGGTGKGQTKHKPPCELCNLSATGLMLVAGGWVDPFIPPSARTGQTAQTDQRVEVIRRLRPPSRAPPAHIV
jgi:hypothetical protein